MVAMFKIASSCNPESLATASPLPNLEIDRMTSKIVRSDDLSQRHRRQQSGNAINKAMVKHTLSKTGGDVSLAATTFR